MTTLRYNNRTVQIVVLDNEALNLTADTQTISEAGGVVNLTVSRPGVDLAAALPVQVSVSHPSRLRVPNSVVIPAGQASVTFQAQAIDNQIRDDAQPVRITVAAAGLGESSLNVLVTDDESLQLTFSPTIISEAGGITTGTLTRFGDLSKAVAFALSHNQPGKVNLPTQVTLRAGQSSATFLAAAIDNSFYNSQVVVDVFGDIDSLWQH